VQLNIHINNKLIYHDCRGWRRRKGGAGGVLRGKSRFGGGKRGFGRCSAETCFVGRVTGRVGSREELACSRWYVSCALKREKTINKNI
jgi:hypothetical protein